MGLTREKSQDHIECPLGGIVESTFQLDYKKADVALLPNAADFRKVAFQLFCEAGGILNAGFEGQIRPQSVKVNADDQQVTVRWTFKDFPKSPGTFKVDQNWQLQMQYVAEDFDSSFSEKTAIVIGTVHITAP
jgi:hypothetical protein